MTRISLFIWSTVFVMLAGFAFEYLGRFVGLSMAESLNDPIIIIASLMLPICLIGPLFIPLPTLVDRFKFILGLLGLGIWAYFSYQYITYEDYALAQIPSDIKLGVSWLLENRKIVLLFVAGFIGVTLLRRLGAFSGRAISEHIESSMTDDKRPSENGRI